MSDENVGGLVIQWRHNAQGCGRGDAQAAATWRSCARQLEAALSAHGQPPPRVTQEMANSLHETAQLLDEVDRRSEARREKYGLHGQPVVDEAAQEAIADILNRMESWSKAYPVEVFHEPTKEERDWLHKTRPGLMDCIAASMGRHMAKCIAGDLAKLTAALTGADHE